MAKWADPSERCRELARREREIYDQQELPDLLEHMAEENARLRAEAANSAAQRDEALNQLDSARHSIDVLEARYATLKGYSAESDRLLKYARVELAAAKMDADHQCRERVAQWERAEALQAKLARIRAADRTSITVRTTEAAKMRKGQAI